MNQTIASAGIAPDGAASTGGGVEAPAAGERPPAPSPQVAAWVSEFVEGWRAPSGPDALADHFARVVAPDVRLIQPQMPTVVGPRALRERFARPLFALVPDLRADVERWAGGEDFALIELTLSGTLGGRPVSWRVVDRVTIRDGVAVERESYLDPIPLLRAVLTRPRAWPRFAAMRLAELRGRRSG
jgi:hypothetical protein